MEHFLTAQRAQKDGAIKGGAEKLHASIGLGNIGQPPRPELDALESGKVGPVGRIIIHARQYVAPVSGRKFVLRDLFKILHAERVLGAFDQRGMLLRRELLGPGESGTAGQKS